MPDAETGGRTLTPKNLNSMGKTEVPPENWTTSLGENGLYIHCRHQHKLGRLSQHSDFKNGDCLLPAHGSEFAFVARLFRQLRTGHQAATRVS